MKITPVNKTDNIRYPSCIPAFKGAVEDFGKHIGDTFCKTNILPEEKSSLLREFKKVVNDIIDSGRELGRGFHGIVYKIDDNFALKIYRVMPKSPQDTNIVEIGENKFKNLETYFGEPVGKFGDVKILRNLGEHIPAAVPNKILNDTEHNVDINKYYQTVYLPAFAKIPQESYDAVARDFARLNKLPSGSDRYFSFDGVNPTNIVLSGNKLILTDEIGASISPDTNTTGKLLDMLLFRETVLKRINGYGDNVKDAFEIFKKIIIASEKADLPLRTLPKDCMAWFGVMKNLGFNISSDKFIEDLSTMRKMYPDIKDRIPEVEKYIKTAARGGSINS